MNRDDLLKQSQLTPNQFATTLESLGVVDGEWFEQADCDRVLEAVTQPDEEVDSRVGADEGTTPGGQLTAGAVNRAALHTVNQGNAMVHGASNQYKQMGSSLRGQMKEVAKLGNDHVMQQGMMGLVEGTLEDVQSSFVVEFDVPKFASGAQTLQLPGQTELDSLLNGLPALPASAQSD